MPQPDASTAIVYGTDPRTGKRIEPGFPAASGADVARHCETANSAFDAFRETALETRAAFLDKIAEEILALRDALIDVAALETALDLPGQLTVALMEPDDYAIAAQLLPLTEKKAGRILVNGFGTGVEVGHAMVHGGPFPATSDGRTTSVGSLAIDRFLRPMCYQDMPAGLLPPELQDGHADGIARLVDGAWQRH